MSLHAGSLLAIVGVAAWATGEPLLFPSIGPSAYLYAKLRRGDAVAPRRVVGGHAIGAAAGLVAHHGLAADVVVTAMPPQFSTSALMLTVAAALSVALTTAGMIVTGTDHPPACATTLIVALGLLSTPVQAALIVVTVVGLVIVQESVFEPLLVEYASSA